MSGQQGRVADPTVLQRALKLCTYFTSSSAIWMQLVAAPLRT